MRSNEYVGEGGQPSEDSDSCRIQFWLHCHIFGACIADIPRYPRRQSISEQQNNRIEASTHAILWAGVVSISIVPKISDPYRVRTLFGGPAQPQAHDPRGGIFRAKEMGESNEAILNANQYENDAVSLLVLYMLLLLIRFL